MAHFPKPFFKKARKVWYVEIDRRQINLGPDREEAFRRYHQLMAQPRHQRVGTNSLAVIIDVFLEWVQRNRAPDTYEWYRYRLERFIQRYPDLRTGDIRPYHVETWVQSYQLSVTSRRNYLGAVKRYLKWAKRQGYIDRNPIDDLEVPVAERKEVAIDRDEFERLLTYAANPALSDLIVVTWETGCRPQESLRVEARHVDLKNERWVFPKSEAKMKRIARVIYLTEPALTITKRQMLAHPVGRLFRNTSGKPWTPDAVNCGFDRIRIAMGKDAMRLVGETVADVDIAKLIPTLKPTRAVKGTIVEKRSAELRAEAKRKLTNKRAAQFVPRYSLYMLRHSWATNALKQGIDPLTVAILMGHQDPSTLARVYQHLSLSPKHLLGQARKAAG